MKRFLCTIAAATSLVVVAAPAASAAAEPKVPCVILGYSWCE